jgi:hypothetical protein
MPFFNPQQSRICFKIAHSKLRERLEQVDLIDSIEIRTQEQFAEKSHFGIIDKPLDF